MKSYIQAQINIECQSQISGFMHMSEKVNIYF